MQTNKRVNDEVLGDGRIFEKKNDKKLQIFEKTIIFDNPEKFSNVLVELNDEKLK